MAIERIIGIDFGTSTSVIRVKRYEDGKPVGEKLETKEVVFSGLGATVPTLIQKKDDDESIVYFGYEAQQKRKKTTTYHSFKVDLESSDPEKCALARKLTEEFFCYLAKTYKAQSEGGHLGDPGDKERTIVSYPVKWSEETRQFMIAAARKAGFPDVTGMDEAQAAIQAVTVMSEDHLRKNGLLINGKPCNILLIDMGAGTTDLVLCRYTPGAEAKAAILSTWPKDGEILFGGREVDSLLQDYFRDMMDEESANLVFRRVGLEKFKSWKENTVSPALWKNDSVTDFEPLDNQIEDNDIDMNEYCLDRAEFEKCLKEYLKQLPKLINDCIDNSKIKPSDVDLVIVTGGHSQWYFVKEMLTGKMTQFGKLELTKITADSSRIVPIARPQETVTIGLVFGKVTKIIKQEELVMQIINVDCLEKVTDCVVTGKIKKGRVQLGQKIKVAKIDSDGIEGGLVYGIAANGKLRNYAIEGEEIILLLCNTNLPPRFEQGQYLISENSNWEIKDNIHVRLPMSTAHYLSSFPSRHKSVNIYGKAYHWDFLRTTNLLTLHIRSSIDIKLDGAIPVIPGEKIEFKSPFYPPDIFLEGIIIN